MTEQESRKQFEKWISSPPYERQATRIPATGSWPGHYQFLDVRLAWEAWQEARRTAPLSRMSETGASGDIELTWSKP